jgi:CheY-like chemotaxis protein
MKRRILLADDSVTIQKVIELTFMDEDYEVRAVSNGDEAVALLHEVNPDFVIADVHMPGANGYEVCRRAKQARPDVPVLLLVGTFEPFDEGQARAAGADSFLKKPFDSQELLQRVQDLLVPSASAAPAMPATPEQMPAMMAVPDFAAPPENLPLTPPEPALDFPAEPAWGSFELEAEPEPAPSPFAAPSQFSAPEPFDREPSFSLEPDPAFPASSYQAPEEPVFSLDGGEQSYALQEDVFGAPSELSFDDTPQDRYLPEEPASPAAGFDWAATAGTPASEPEPLRFEEEPVNPTWPEPVAPSSWELPAEPEPEPEPLSAPQPAWAAPDPASIYAPAIDPAMSAPEPAPEPAYAVSTAAAPASNGNGRLSDDDVDRIARRVVELLGDKAVRDVAWEVIPDMAEVVIRDRLRELEAQVE